MVDIDVGEKGNEGIGVSAYSSHSSYGSRLSRTLWLLFMWYSGAYPFWPYTVPRPPSNVHLLVPRSASSAAGLVDLDKEKRSASDIVKT